jgi:hypothetical protein
VTYFIPKIRALTAEINARAKNVYLCMVEGILGSAVNQPGRAGADLCKYFHFPPLYHARGARFNMAQSLRINILPSRLEANVYLNQKAASCGK